jgi:hypothetical protein
MAPNCRCAKTDEVMDKSATGKKKHLNKSATLQKHLNILLVLSISGSVAICMPDVRTERET